MGCFGGNHLEKEHFYLVFLGYEIGLFVLIPSGGLKVVVKNKKTIHTNILFEM